MTEAIQLDWPLAFNFPLLGRLLLAAVLGGIIGFERELSGKPAGLRTNLLICVGAALLMELSINVATVANIQNLMEGTDFRADPGRIAAQIVSGIGFLGAGTILVMRGNVIGLTTAATIWVVAAIGMAVGSRAYFEALGATLLVVVALTGMTRIERYVTQRRGTRQYRFRVAPDDALVQRIRSAFHDAGLAAANVGFERHEDHFDLDVQVNGTPRTQQEVVEQLMTWPDVRRVTQVS